MRRVLRQADGGRAQTSLSWLADTLLSQHRTARIKFCRPTGDHAAALSIDRARVALEVGLPFGLQRHPEHLLGGHAAELVQSDLRPRPRFPLASLSWLIHNFWLYLPRHIRADATGSTPLVGMLLLDRHSLNIEVESGGRVVIIDLTVKPRHSRRRG